MKTDKNSNNIRGNGFSEDFSQMESLENRTFLSATAFTEFGAPSFELPVNGSVSVSGTIEDVDGEDYYSFIAPATGKITVEMTGQGSLDSFLELYSASEDGTRISSVRSNNDIDLTSKDSSVGISCRTGQRFYVKADSFMDRSSGDYELTFTNTTRDDFSSDISKARQARMASDGSGAAIGIINSGTDVDLLKIVAPRDGYMTVQMSGITQDSALENGSVSVTDVSGAVLSSADGFGSASAETGFVVSAGQTYYIYVSSGDNSVGRYSIELSTGDIDPDNNNDGGDDGSDNSGGDSGNNDGAVNNGELSIEDLEAADTVSGSYYTLNGDKLLVVLGTDGSDWIELGVNSSEILVNDGSNVTAFDGDVDGVIIFGFGGDDYIRTDASMVINTSIYGGDGNDSLYDAGQGSAIINGQGGDDLLVSIGGSNDTLIGSTGLDSFWADNTDNVSDASAQENAAQSVHVVKEFYQPYTTNKSAADYIPLSIDGQNFTDPQATGISNGWENYADSPLFVGDPSYSDIDQGSVGDCYFLSSLAGYSNTDPQVIKQMMTDLGDGTYAVRFFRNGKANYVRVDADLPTTNGRLSYAGLGEDGEIWAAVAEKAYAHFRTGEDSYASLDSGWMHTVYKEITNSDVALKWSYGMSTSSMFNYVSGLLEDGATLSVGSKSGGDGPIAGGHAYAVLGVETIDGEDYVTVHNPWGTDGRYYDSNYYDGVLKITAQQFKDAFIAIAVSYA